MTIHSYDCGTLGYNPEKVRADLLEADRDFWKEQSKHWELIAKEFRELYYVSQSLRFNPFTEGG